MMHVSVVVCTDGSRPDGLAATLASLEQFSAYATPIVVYDTVGNLSRARNIGIRRASSDLVAFIDDDAVADMTWLPGLIMAFADPAIMAAGGFVRDSSPSGFQCRYASANRAGGVNLDLTLPMLHEPLAETFPLLIGTNCAFRATALRRLNGFDEEFDYFLDDVDICARLNDAGMAMAQVAGASVFHKRLPSRRRHNPTMLKSWRSLIKNIIYFGLLNRRTASATLYAANQVIEQLHGRVCAEIADGRRPTSDLAIFWRDAEQGLVAGLARGLSGERRLMGEN
jgi:glycogen(starch) synthase